MVRCRRGDSLTPLAIRPGACYNLVHCSGSCRWTVAGKTTTLDEVLDASEQLSPVDQLRLISLLSERLRSAMAQGNEWVDILSLAGLGAELWQGIDVAAYLDQERDSWGS